MKLMLSTMNKIKIDDNLVCKICQTKHKTPNARNKCIRSHGMDASEYIIKYYFNNTHPKCKCGCGTNIKNIKWIKDEIHYSDYIRNHFPRNPHTEETKEKIKLNTIKVIQEKFGVDNVFQLDTIKEKIKKTNLEKYGVDNPMKNKSIAEKARHSQTAETIKKIKQTNLKKYGAHAYTATSSGKEKIKQTIHDRYGKENPMYVDDVVVKVKNTNIEKYGYDCNFNNPEYRKKYNTKKSKYEEIVANALGGIRGYRLDGYEYDVKFDNYLIEIDGDYYHPNDLTDLSFTQLNGILNDIRKNEIANESEYDLLRIKVSDLKKIDNISLQSIIKHSYTNQYNLDYRQTFLTKDYIKKYIDKYGKDKMKTYIPLVLKFVRTLSSEFPKIQSKETSEMVCDYIKSFDVNNMIDSNGHFLNKNYDAGVSLLKSMFNAYWNSSYKGNKSPIEAWSDDEVMYRIISYRMGFNKSNEIYNISLSNLIYGLSVNRYTISFFRPTLAATIYQSYLGNNKYPKVLDPCAGFGGRLLGFKLKYPNGKYIGIEPNKEIYTGLCKLIDIFKFENVELYNCKIEDFEANEDYDLVFTSIPYYDLEDYNNTFSYSTLQQWKDIFIQSLLRFDKLIINTNIDIYNIISDSFTINNKIINYTSPFNDKKTKYELLLKKT